MKIRVTLTVEVDPEDWCSAYGIERQKLRDDVKSYIANNVAVHDTDAPIKVLSWE